MMQVEMKFNEIMLVRPVVQPCFLSHQNKMKKYKGLFGTLVEIGMGMNLTFFLNTDQHSFWCKWRMD
jgi:hypothetical protein